MHPVETILILMVLTTVLALAARRVSVPYPIFLVLGGLGLAFVPGLPTVALDPQLVFLFFLPPILYAAAFFTSWRDFRDNLVSISLLAVGLVAATTTAVAAAVHFLVPGIPWAAAFVLGAIVSPPDAVAATAIAQRLHLPRRMVTIIEGESLVNDATGLVFLKFATVAVVSARFSMAAAAGDFALLVVGGIAVGLAVGWLFTKAQRFLDDAVLATTASILVSLATYILAERLHVSGVLAVVAAGLVQGRSVPYVWTSEMRIQGMAVWETVVFLLNALVFVLIGLQLPVALREMRPWPWSTIVDGIFAVCGTVIVVRLLWVFPGAYLPRLLFPKLREKNPYPDWRHVLVVGWSGMRGVVSLAAALSLPLFTASGEPFPARGLIVFLTFAVILVTLVLQGLTLPPLIRWIGVAEDRSSEREELLARQAMAEAALARVDEVAEVRGLPAHQIHSVRTEFVNRLRGMKVRDAASQRDSKATEEALASLRRESIQAQRDRLLRLRHEEIIGDDVLHRLQYDLDIEELGLKTRGT
jgi:Na+/H+ antiporter